MAPGRAVDRADQRHLDFEEAHQEVPAFPMDAVDPVPAGPGREGGRAGGGARAGELGAGAGQDHDAVVAVAADVVKGFRQFAVGRKPQRSDCPSVCNVTSRMPSRRSMRTVWYLLAYSSSLLMSSLPSSSFTLSRTAGAGGPHSETMGR